jgi:hypothetical protein
MSGAPGSRSIAPIANSVRKLSSRLNAACLVTLAPLNFMCEPPAPGIDVEVKIDSSLKGKSLQETVAHEGSYVGDFVSFLTSINMPLPLLPSTTLPFIPWPWRSSKPT